MLVAMPVAGVWAAAPSGTDPTADALPLIRPSIQYEQSVAHADDEIAFAAGARVSVPFEPRAADSWAIDGDDPLALPAGRLTGKSIREAEPTLDATSGGEGVTAPARPSGPIDVPTIDPSASIATHLAAVVDPGRVMLLTETGHLDLYVDPAVPGS